MRNLILFIILISFILLISCSSADSVLQVNSMLLDENSGGGSGGKPADWWDDSMSYRRRLTFNNLSRSTALLNFPVMVKLNSSRIRYNAAQNNGEDIRFIDSDGSLLSHEIETWNESGDSIVWVKIPEIDASSNSDYIYMYYGNDSTSDGQDAVNVWDSNFAQVWHLDETPSGGEDFDDSCNYNDNGSNHNGMSQNMDGTNQVSGIAGYGVNLNGTNEWIDAGSPDPGFFHDAISTITMEFWINADNTSSLQTLFETGGGTNGIYVGLNSNNVRVVTRNGGAGNEREANNSFSDTSNFHYIVGVFENGTIRLYVDGAEVDSTSTGYSSIGSHSGQPSFGFTVDGDSDGNGASSGYFDGVFDEIRMSGSVRSADWIDANYDSIADNLISFGSEQ